MPHRGSVKTNIKQMFAVQPFEYNVSNKLEESSVAGSVVINNDIYCGLLFFIPDRIHNSDSFNIASLCTVHHAITGVHRNMTWLWIEHSFL